VRTLRIRRWLLIAGCLVVTAVVYCTIHLRSRTPANPQAIASAEGEVYEAVVRDMVRPTDEQASISQLVFDDTVLTDLTTGADTKSCQDSVRKRLRLGGNNTPRLIPSPTRSIAFFTAATMALYEPIRFRIFLRSLAPLVASLRASTLICRRRSLRSGAYTLAT
jgi:hypothetical protein